MVRGIRGITADRLWELSSIHVAAVIIDNPVACADHRQSDGHAGPHPTGLQPDPPLRHRGPCLGGAVGGRDEGHIQQRPRGTGRQGQGACATERSPCLLTNSNHLNHQCFTSSFVAVFFLVSSSIALLAPRVMLFNRPYHVTSNVPLSICGFNRLVISFYTCREGAIFSSSKVYHFLTVFFGDHDRKQYHLHPFLVVFTHYISTNPVSQDSHRPSGGRWFTATSSRNCRF